MQQEVTCNGSPILIEGARQMGKTSLFVRAVAHVRTPQYIIVDFNFQLLDEQHLENLERLLRYLADALHERLRLATSADVIWQRPVGSKEKLTSFIRDHVLLPARMPVVVVMDEVDRVFTRPYQHDFFGLLRSWHDERARDALWEKLTLIPAYSTDPRQAIRDLNQSPFNVGYKIDLRDFSFDEVRD
jgi:Cdc6-like AAA superfamily ATPase